MTVVCDTSAITALLQINRDSLLSNLFTRVTIPPAVFEELKRYHTTLPHFLQIAEVQNKERINELLTLLDPGEAEAIVLTEESSPDFLILDDSAARAIAINKGLPVIGLVGVLIRAKRAQLIPALAPILADLEQIAGFRISPELKRRVLASNSE